MWIMPPPHTEQRRNPVKRHRATDRPDSGIRLYLVAPDDRRDKVEQEILRPTFTLREKPLRDVCGFLSFSKLVEKAEGIRRLGIASVDHQVVADGIESVFTLADAFHIAGGCSIRKDTPKSSGQWEASHLEVFAYDVRAHGI
jgi:hypothetical protein